MIARKALLLPILANKRSTTNRRIWQQCLLLGLLIFSGTALAQVVDPTAVPPIEALTEPTIASPMEPPAITEPDPAAPIIREEPPLYKSRSERNNQLLATAAAEEARWLDTPGEPALALFRPIETRTNKGALLILHAAEIPSDWPPALENVRRALPQHGWATFALALPPLSTPAVPDRELQTNPTEPAVSEDPAAEPDAIPVDPAEPAEPAEPADPVEPAAAEPPPSETIDEPLPTRAEIIASRLEAALAWLTQEQQAPVFLLIDNSSVIDSLTYLQTLDENPIAGMILVNLQAQEQLATTELEAIFTAIAPPTLDVFFQSGHGQVSATRKNHRAVALRNKMPVYQQLHLPPQRPATVDDKKSFWVERLRGFMEQQTDELQNDKR